MKLIMYLYIEPNLKLEQGRTKSGHLFAMATKCFRVASNISGSSVSNLLHVTLIAPIIFMWLLDVWTICAPLEYSYTITPLHDFTRSTETSDLPQLALMSASHGTVYRCTASHPTHNIPHIHRWKNLISRKLQPAATKLHGITSHTQYPS